jgi:hypothetical protein
MVDDPGRRKDRKSVVEEMRGGLVKPAPVKRPLRSEQAQQLRKTVGQITSPDERFMIDLERQILEVTDQSNVVRVQIGLLTAAPTYGIRLYNSSGTLVFEVADLEKLGEQDYATDIVFNVSGIGTVSWGAGFLVLKTGEIYSVLAGSASLTTAAPRYIYLDADVSSTTLQVTTTLSQVVGARAYLLATAYRGVGDDASASVIPTQGSPRIASSNLTVDAIRTVHLRAGSVTAGKLSISELSEIVEDAGILVSGVLRNTARRFLNLGATGTAAFLRSDSLRLLANGAATFAGFLKGAGGSFGEVVAGLMRNEANTAGIFLGGAYASTETLRTQSMPSGSSASTSYTVVDNARLYDISAAIWQSTLPAQQDASWELRRGATLGGSVLIGHAYISEGETQGYAELSADITVAPGEILWIVAPSPAPATLWGGTPTLTFEWQMHLSLSLPGWTRYLNLAATGAQPFLKHEALELRADGTRIWPDEVANPRLIGGCICNGVFTGTGVAWTVEWVPNPTTMGDSALRVRLDLYVDDFLLDIRENIARDGGAPYTHTTVSGIPTGSSVVRADFTLYVPSTGVIHDFKRSYNVPVT